MSDYISKQTIEEVFDGIYDCADLVFEPDDHCCLTDDCGHCKWVQTKNAIRKRIMCIPPADVRPVARGEWEEIAIISDAYDISGVITWASEMCCQKCGFTTYAIEGRFLQYNFCPNCGAKMGGTP